MNDLAELLAPAGDREALVAAVQSRADAVYLAGTMFGARAYAANFDRAALTEAIRYAHLYGVRVYVTVNTLVDNGEMAELADYLRFLYTAGADAVIVQDLGAAELARRVAPDLPLHASTQMTVHNREGVRCLRQWGFRRVVLAREVPLAEIKAICAGADAEIEVFVHGALCICYSGQCLLSGMIGGRSGNRGRCAQPCRLPYTLVDAAGRDVLAGADVGAYLLSPRDLNTIDLLPELLAAGVASLKIEGRMKRPEYVAVAVDAYRRAIDAYAAGRPGGVSERERKDLTQIFNRGFTTAYLKGRPGRTMMSDRRPNNRGVRAGRVVAYDGAAKTAAIQLDEPLRLQDIVEFWVKVGGRVSATVQSMTVDGRASSCAPAGATAVIAVDAPVRVNDRVFKVSDAALMERTRSFLGGAARQRRIAVDILVRAREGEPLTVELTDEDGFWAQARTESAVVKAVNRPLTTELLTKQLGRLGATAFVLRDLTNRIAGAVMAPVSQLNEARRKAVVGLETARLAGFARPPLPPASVCITKARPGDAAPLRRRRPELFVHADDLAKAAAAFENGADGVWFGGENFSRTALTRPIYEAAVDLARRQGKQIVLTTPRLANAAQMIGVRADLELFETLRPDAVGVANLGTLYIAREITDAPLYADYPLNIYNNLAIEFLREARISLAVLSPELNFAQLEAIAGASVLPLACVVHGRLPLMVTEYCAPGGYLGGAHTGRCSGPCQRGPYWLKDRKAAEFPLAMDQFCRMHVLNAKELHLLKHAPRFGNLGVSQIRIEGKHATDAEVGRVTRLYREVLDQGEDHPLARQDAPAGGGVTRGHYFRGVL